MGGLASSVRCVQSASWWQGPVSRDWWPWNDAGWFASGVEGEKAGNARVVVIIFKMIGRHLMNSFLHPHVPFLQRSVALCSLWQVAEVPFWFREHLLQIKSLARELTFQFIFDERLGQQGLEARAVQ